MNIATWNVNSLRIRLPQLLGWMAAHPAVGLLAVQETKLEDAVFPLTPIQAAGLHVVHSGQKTYNGVALIARAPLTEVHIGLPPFAQAPGMAPASDPQQRLIAATLMGVRVVCVYVPNGQSVGSDKYAYKLAWLDTLVDWLREELQRYPQLAVLGDYNIAPADADVHDPAAWAGGVLVSEAERARFDALCALGLYDAFRLFAQPEKSFSWWDYRAAGFRRNAGLRIDHILLSSALRTRCTASWIDTEPRRAEQPSDHTPVLATLGQ